MNNEKGSDMKTSSYFRDERKRLGISLQAIADIVGCSRQFVSTVELQRRRVPPSWGTVKEIMQRVVDKQNAG